MNILFIAHRIPYPPNKGDKIRSFNILKYLSKRYNVFLACLIDSKKDIKYINDLENYCNTIDWELINTKYRYFLLLKSFFLKRPSSVSIFYSKKLQKKINHRIKKQNFDIIYCFSSQSAEYVKLVDHKRKIMDFGDVDSIKWRQYAVLKNNYFMKLLYKKESKYLAKYENKIAKSFSKVIFVSDFEVKLFRNEICNTNNILAIHNGVDYRYFNPKSTIKKTKLCCDSPIILFTGAMDYYPNIDGVLWFINDIFPLITKKVHRVKFYIVGNNPSSKIKKLHNNDNIFVTGYVNDIRQYFKQAQIFVAPFRVAGGVQNKILEAFSMNIPVVSTSIGAAGLKEIGSPVFIKNTKKDFAECVISRLTNPNNPTNKRNIYRQWVINNYNWQKNLSKLDELCENIHNIKR